MSTLIAKLWKMRGGIHPAFHKEESTRLTIKQLSIPPQLIIPVQQSMGDQSVLVVAVGDKVLKGQPLTEFGSTRSGAVIHASSSGTVTAIKEHPLPHPSAMSGLCVFIETDGADQWLDSDAPVELSSQATVQLDIMGLAQASLEGLSHDKILEKINGNEII